MIELMHNSADSKYRNPIGALKTNERTHIRFMAPNDGRHVTIFICENDKTYEQTMDFVDGMWQYALTATANTCVMWYYFVMRNNGNTSYYGVEYGKTAGWGQFYSQNPSGFQVTVYDKTFDTPSWFRKSTMYQIFPDRFCQGDKHNLEKGMAYHKNMGRQVVAHDKWEETPLFTPINGDAYYSPCDFFGGDLKGIEQNLDYLKDLGITCLYLNPIVEAASNHRYDTGNYKIVDPVLGTNDDFDRLCKKAKKSGIRIILDGVYSHTGADSIYFNKNHNYEGEGAYQGKESAFYKWYTFFGNNQTYKSWWGFETLPEVNEMDPSWQEFVISGNNSVFSHWLSLGASGYRLDVADELPDEIIAEMRKATKKNSKDNVLLGEVWEDATIKESYGVKRQYALGSGLDSVMNYPFKNECINFLLGYTNGYGLKNFLITQCTNYPKPMYYCLMNLLSSHDIPRIRTVLATRLTGDNMSREEQAAFVIPYQREEEGAKLTRLAMAIQFAIPGVPSVYYGDEYGMNGLKDPFNRGTFTKNDNSLYEFSKKIGKLRQKTDALQTGHVGFFAYNDDVVAVLRFILDGRDAFGEDANNGVYLVLVNRGSHSQRIEVDLKAFTEGIDEKQGRLLNIKRFNCVKSMVNHDCILSLQRNILEVTVSPYDFELIKMD